MKEINLMNNISSGRLQISRYLVFIILFLGLTGDVFANDKTSQTKSRYEQLELFNKVLYLIESQYYREVDTIKLIQGAIKGMMDTLDPHSAFLSKDIFEKMQAETSGEFGGLGIEVTQKDGTLYIISPIDDTPAFLAGLKSGDKIVEIDHTPALGMTLEESVKKMKGAPGSKVHLGILREGQDGVMNFNLIRKVIHVHPVKNELLAEKFAYLRLTQFQKNSAQEIRAALDKMAEKDKVLEGIILDLRSNPGGLLEEAIEVSSIFLKEGVVVSTESRDVKQKEFRYVMQKGEKYLDVPMIVLINGASASASEIVAGALQDHKRAIIMGVQSFGKGSVQTVAKIDEDNGLKLTIAQYLTPNQRRIQAVGIRPDVELDEYDASWNDEHKSDDRYIREIDLKNHLNATVETSDEKNDRERKEKEERGQRIKDIEDRKNQVKDKKKQSNGEEVEFQNYDPKTDFQVRSAVNFLKSFKVFKNMHLGTNQSAK